MVAIKKYRKTFSVPNATHGQFDLIVSVIGIAKYKCNKILQHASKSISNPYYEKFFMTSLGFFVSSFKKKSLWIPNDDEDDGRCIKKL